MGKYFGTDGFRGEANVNLTVEHAYKVGRYIGWYFNQKTSRAKIVIGKDTRRSSYMFENALVAGLTASGADAYMLYVTTTPSVAYVVRTEQFDCGIMISASHNPFYDNGIKLINAKGHKMEAEVEEKVEAYIDGEIDEIPFATKKEIGRARDYTAGRNHYIGYLISSATRSFKGMKVGLDCANGSSFAMRLEDNSTAAAIAGYVGTTEWRLPVYSYDESDVMEYYDIPSRYEIPDNSESVTEAHAGDVFYSDPNRIVLYYQDAGINEQYTRIGTFDATEEFVDAVVNNPVLEGWGNQIVIIGDGE